LGFVYLVLATIRKFYSALIRNSIITSGIFGAFLLKLTGLENNIYAQVAMVMLIGLLGKMPF
jgi:HAE1 family hydrophobic/amphiphilic exporter-1